MHTQVVQATQASVDVVSDSESSIFLQWSAIQTSVVQNAVPRPLAVCSLYCDAFMMQLKFHVI